MVGSSAHDSGSHFRRYIANMPKRAMIAKPSEVTALVCKLQNSHGSSQTDPTVRNCFLEETDGRQLRVASHPHLELAAGYVKKAVNQ